MLDIRLLGRREHILQDGSFYVVRTTGSSVGRKGSFRKVPVHFPAARKKQENDDEIRPMSGSLRNTENTAVRSTVQNHSIDQSTIENTAAKNSRFVVGRPLVGPTRDGSFLQEKIAAQNQRVDAFQSVLNSFHRG